MAIVLKDRVKVAATTTGTGTFTLGAAANGYQNFSAIGNGSETYYTIAAQSGSEWEVGKGTVTDTAGTFTLSRDTVLESSNAGSLVNFSAGTKDVFVTYPAERAVYLDAAGSAVTTLDIGTLGTSTANITTANITAGTVTTAPASGNDLVNKTYVDTLAASGIHFHQPVRVESPINLNATYNNGTAGVGATLTNAGTQAALVVDGVTVSVADRVLVYEQTNQTQNGIYVVTDVGSGSTNWVLTRASDADTYVINSANGLSEGSTTFVQQGATGAGETYTCNTTGTFTFGTTNITFAQISSAQIYSAGTGLTLSGTQFSITNTGTAGTYGSLSTVPVFTTNAQGQVTSVTNTAIGITSAAVSGLAPSATTDTTNAANITSGALPVARLNGSYTGVTGVGTLAAGTWNGSTIAAAYGGTGQSSYAVGDLLYADTTTSLAKLADIVSGNALLSGGVGTAPAWGKIGLTTHISGTLAITNGGTGATDAATARSNLGAGTGNGSVTSVAAGSYLTGGTITTTGTLAVDATTTNTAGKVVARDGSGDFSAGTVTANLSGNATTATTATTANALNAANSYTVSGLIVSTGSSYIVANRTSSGSGQVGYNWAQGGSNLWWNYVDTGGTTLNWYNSVSTSNIMTLSTGGALNAVGAITQNGSQVLHASNYTSYAPSLTGSGASGTWSINVTGNAATATTADNIDGIAFKNSNSTSAFVVDSQGTNGIGYSTGYTLFGQNDGAVYCATYSDAWQHQINGDFRTGQIAIRGKNSGTWQAWRVVLDSSNYTSYSPSLTGSGASGTWSINVTGSAGSATTATTANALNASNSYTAVAFTASSDERLKTNWRDLPADFVDQLARVKHGTYDRVDQELTQDGVSAQSLQPLLSNSVIKGEDGKLSVNYGNAALVSAIQLAQRVVEQDARIAKLEALVAQLTKGNTP